MVNDEKALSYTIQVLRFPMAILVVAIHANVLTVVINGSPLLDSEPFSVAGKVIGFIVGILSQPAVPVFYVLAGYLFFYKTDTFNVGCYLSKLKRRFRSLLVPYLFWNLAYICLLMVAQIIRSDVLSGLKKSVLQWTAHDWLWAFWDMSVVNGGGRGGPADPPLYFVADILLMSLFSPVVYYLLKNKYLGLVLLFAVSFSYVFDSWLGLEDGYVKCISFFAWGAYFAIHKVNIAEQCGRILNISLPLCLVMMILSFFCQELLFGRAVLHVFFYFAVVVIVGISFKYVSARIYKTGKSYVPSSMFSGSSFFIYASHAIVLSAVIKPIIRFIAPTSDVVLIMCYLLCITIGVAIPLLLYKIITCKGQRYVWFITGGR